MDISGLGTPSGQLTPYAVPRLDRAGTDEMRYVRQRVALSPGQHRPTWDGQEVSPWDYRADLTTGFQTMYRVLLAHRDELLSPTGPLTWFATDEVRVLVRPTSFYAQLLSESFHPDILRDALDRDRHLDYLWLGTKQQPSLVPFIRHERHALYQGDIPLFTTYPQSHQVWSSDGTPIAHTLCASGLQRVHQRLHMFGEHDLARQVWIINAALDAEVMGQEQRQPARADLPASVLPATSAQLLEAAGAIGDYLEMLAIRQDTVATWLGLVPTPAHQWFLQPLGVDLYGGCPGVVLFLAYLGAVTGEARYTALAQAAFTCLQHYLTAATVPNIGAFEGWGGLIYVFTHLSAVWAQPALLAAAEAMVAHIEAGIEHDTRFDVISGAAGALLALRSLYHYLPSARTLALLVRCGHHLLTHTRTLRAALACSAPVDETSPLAGMSHGAAGMAWALCELARLTGEQRFRQAAVDAMTYERHLFDAKARNWPDLRVDPAVDTVPRARGARFMSAWCHGAPGVGLARLQILRHWATAEVRTEIDHALHTTRAEGFGHNHSLCHGDLGNVELLFQAGVQLKEPGLLVEVQHLASRIMASIATYGWRCGITQGVETPGLMTGLAGIGYGLLRLARPQCVPSVLTLDTPPQGRET
jgi:type 2 lantibiotic biosynthesis protein LanM